MTAPTPFHLSHLKMHLSHHQEHANHHLYVHNVQNGTHPTAAHLNDPKLHAHPITQSHINNIHAHLGHIKTHHPVVQDVKPTYSPAQELVHAVRRYQKSIGMLQNGYLIDVYNSPKWQSDRGTTDSGQVKEVPVDSHN
jgi:hypothetical protein